MAEDKRIPNRDSRLEPLHQMVKLNFCDKCYPKYLAFIEPGIQQLLLDYFDDWRFTESCVTQMVMVHKGVFKTDLHFIAIGEWDDRFHKDVDKDLFDHIKGWNFQWKIDYLKKHKILPEQCYKLLNVAREKRNLLHEHPFVYTFSNEDRTLFSICNAVSSNLHSIMRGTYPETSREIIMEMCVKTSYRRARAKGCLAVVMCW